MRLKLTSPAVGCTVLLGGTWILYVYFGNVAARFLFRHLEKILIRMGDGKFSDPVTFLHGRILEFLTLTTLSVILLVAFGYLGRWLKTKPAWTKARGLILGGAAFVFLNILAWAGGQTVLFWTLFYDSVHINTFAQYQIKKALLSETEAKQRAILMGNSQANRSIDEVLLNQILGETLWTTELTQAGARGFDLLTLSRDIPFKKGDLVICYVSEITFYGAGSGKVAADCMNFSELPVALELKGLGLILPGAVRSGLLGRIMPVYRFRMSVSKMILGSDFTNMDQTHFDLSVVPDLARQAEEWAPKLRIGQTSAFEQSSFTRMIDELSAKDCTILLISGNLHPTLERFLDPAVTQHLDDFLKDQRTRHPEHVILLERNELATQAISDFDDLVHFNDAAQATFTRRLAEFLNYEMPEKHRQTSPPR